MRSRKTRQILSKLMIEVSMIQFQTVTTYTLILDGLWNKFVAIAVFYSVF